MRLTDTGGFLRPYRDELDRATAALRAEVEVPVDSVGERPLVTDVLGAGGSGAAGDVATGTEVEVVREGGVEPPHPCGYTDLNRARLPVPPLARVRPHRAPEAGKG